MSSELPPTLPDSDPLPHLQQDQTELTKPVVTTTGLVPSRPPTAMTSTQTIVPTMDDEKEGGSKGVPTAGEDGPVVQPTVEEDGSSDPAAVEIQGGNVTAVAEATATTTTPPTPIPPTPQTAITFLLVSGSRRTMSFDPETTIGRVKELVWNAWPTDWKDEQPPAPSYLRILYLGKILQDEDTLAKLSFASSIPSAPPTNPTKSSRNHNSNSNNPPPTIVHLSIRPYAPPSEDDSALKKKAQKAARRALGRSVSSAGALEGGGTVVGAATVGGETVDEGGAGCCCVIC
ncbi:hypothetical protein BD410DRAFT_94919 [Rickenella mellea]|uniref:Ubiquitin-like domain-containing protein n=1 Tax=Rickenella mellea TaxID=50990 RepID=A0A4Y7QAF4_9AGAM|nr:hypothetical protein BD410DRAFT_94919 [Rickenella mellea]